MGSGQHGGGPWQEEQGPRLKGQQPSAWEHRPPRDWGSDRTSLQRAGDNPGNGLMK